LLAAAGVAVGYGWGIAHFELRDEEARDLARNEGTKVISRSELAREADGLSAEVAFISHYEWIRRTCLGLGPRQLDGTEVRTCPLLDGARIDLGGDLARMIFRVAH